MGPGKAFELFVKRILVNIGFSEVVSDGLYIYDGTPGQMIQGLGEAHNANAPLVTILYGFKFTSIGSPLGIAKTP